MQTSFLPRVGSQEKIPRSAALAIRVNSSKGVAPPIRKPFPSEDEEFRFVPDSAASLCSGMMSPKRVFGLRMKPDV